MALVLAFVLLAALAGCSGKEPEEENVSFLSVVTEINGPAMLVRPVEGSDELRSSYSFSIPLDAVSDGSDPQVGDLYRIVYDGYILETYPASLGNIVSVTRVTD